MNGEDILKDLEKESKKIEKWGNKKTSEKDYVVAIIIISAIALGFFVYVNFFPDLFNFNKGVSVEIIEINGCENCFDIKSTADGLISNENLNVKSRKTLDYDSEKAQKLIEEYDIKTIPALIIISKDLNKITLIDGQTFSIKGNYAVFDKAVPYIELDSGETKGLVNLKEVYDSTCEDCMSLSQIQKQFERFGIKINNYEAVPGSIQKGKDLIESNSLTFLPSLLISKNIKEYWWVFDQIKESFVEKKNYYLFKNPIPPYRDISTNQIKGVVDVVYLTDENCENCFDATQLKESFQSLGVFINDEKYVDISTAEGKNLVNKYDIKAVPTVILSKEISDYESIKELLKQIGAFEEDKSFVFRKLNTLNVEYKELE